MKRLRYSLTVQPCLRNTPRAVQVIDAVRYKCCVDTDGSLVEEGVAEPDSIGFVWTYTATAANENLEGARIEITASDLPGNVSQNAVNIY